MGAVAVGVDERGESAERPVAAAPMDVGAGSGEAGPGGRTGDSDRLLRHDAVVLRIESLRRRRARRPRAGVGAARPMPVSVLARRPVPGDPQHAVPLGAAGPVDVPLLARPAG